MMKEWLMKRSFWDRFKQFFKNVKSPVHILCLIFWCLPTGAERAYGKFLFLCQRTSAPNVSHGGLCCGHSMHLPGDVVLPEIRQTEKETGRTGNEKRRTGSSQ